MKAKVIVAQQYTTKMNVQGWVVGITGESKPRMFLRTAKKAMGYMFILKNQTGLNISDNCLQRLAFQYQQVERIHVIKNKMLDKWEQEEDAKIEAIAQQQREEMKAEQSEKKQRKARKPRTKKNTVSA